MRKSTGAMLLILLIITMGLTAIIALNNNNNIGYTPFIQTNNKVIPKNITSASTNNLTNSLVLRNISINNFGIATITDVITVRNDGIDTATFADVFYTADVWSKLLTSSAQFGNIQLSTQQISSGGINGTRILFSNSVAPGENYTFALVQYFDGTLTSVAIPSFGNVSEFDFPASPYSPYTIEVCNVSIALPKGAQTPFSLTANFTNLTPFNTNNTLSTEFVFTDGSSIISLKTVYRQITVDPWRGITVTETNFIENAAPANLTKIYFKAASGTVQLKAYDSAGSIPAWISGDSVIITPHYPVPPNGTYAYYVIYSIPIDFSQVGSSGSYLFAFNILPSYGALIDNFYVSLTFNNFASISSQSPPTISISSSIAENTYLYSFNNVLPTQNVEAYATYSIGLPTTYLRPLVFMLIFGSIAIAYVVIRSRRVEEAAPIIVSPAEVVAPVLREFCDLYEEKNSLILEMDSLREDVLRKKIRKIEYNQRARNSEKEISRLSIQIDQKKTEVLKSNNKFESDFSFLEINEADRDHAKITLQHLKRRYFMKRLSKETYIKLSEEQEKKLNKAESNIDKKIQDLRREAS
ncbi:MAG: hypothetical protein WED07_11050 [Candidatus Freyarchaeum deiterrae]